MKRDGKCTGWCERPDLPDTEEQWARDKLYKEKAGSNRHRRVTSSTRGSSTSGNSNKDQGGMLVRLSQANSCTSDAKEQSSGKSRYSIAALHSLLHVLWRPLAAASSLQSRQAARPASPRRVVTSCINASCCHVLPQRVMLSRPASLRCVVTSCLTALCCHVLPQRVVLSRPPHRVVLSRPASKRRVVTSRLTASCCHVPPHRVVLSCPPHRVVLSRPASPCRVLWLLVMAGFKANASVLMT